jgi:glycosyltransferase involved in cell wall biosynthesis
MSNLASKGKIFYLCLEPVREGHASYTHVIEIVNELKKLGWEVELFKPDYDDNKLPLLAERIIQMLKVQWKLIWSKERPDLIYIRCHPFSFITALWAKLKEIKLIQEVNGHYKDLYVSWSWARYFCRFFEFLYRKQFQWADHIIVVTQGLKNFASQEAKHERISVITNGVNTALFHPKAKTEVNLPSRFVIFFGTFAKWQGISLLLQAVDHAKWPQDLKLVILGDGEERLLVENKAKVSNKVLYLGRKPYAQMAGIIARSIVGLVPKQNIQGNISTGLSPLKLYETIACGVPVIVSEQPEQADFVRENKCGWVVKEQTPEAWAEAVQKATDNTTSSIKISEELIDAISWSRKAKILDEIIIKHVV